MASVNKTILLGGLTRDPEVRYASSGDAIANFSLATNETYKDKQGVKHEKVEYHNCVAYRKLAEIIGEYLKKGSQVYIEGKLQTRKWEKDGITRYSTEIVADTMQMLGGNRDSNTSQENVSQPHNNQQSSKDASNFDDLGDDVPW